MSAAEALVAVQGIKEIGAPGAEPGQAALIQRMEADLIRSEETGASSAHQFEEAQLRAGKMEAIDARLAAHEAEAQILPGFPNASLQENLVKYWSSFSDRTQNFELGSDLARTQSAAAQQSPVHLASANAGHPAPTNTFELATRSLQKSFAFAIETSLVSNISHQSSRTLNTLLKGQ